MQGGTSDTPESLSILLVEHNLGEAETLRTLLSDVPIIQFAIEHHQRLAPALARLNEAPFDVLLMELSVPDSRGLETLEHVLETRPDMAVVVMSARADESIALAAVQRGAQDYLLKGSLDGPAIARALRYAVERRRVQRTLVALQAEQAARRSAEAAQAALRASEERYRSLATFLPIGLLVELRGRVGYVNPAVHELLGHAEARSMIGKLVLDFVHPDDRQAWTESVIRTATNSPIGPHEARLVRRDGSCVSIEVFMIPLAFEGQTATLSVIRDLTTQKAAQRDRDLLTRGERLRSLGQLANGVAHDLNQSLAMVLGYGELALRGLHHDEPDIGLLREQVEVVVRAARDGGETVKRLLAFGRNREKTQMDSVELADVLGNVAQLTRPRWSSAAQAEGRSVEVRVQVEGAPRVHADAAALREALTSMVLNALDAMPLGGTIVLRGIELASHVQVEVEDTGHGMPAEVAAHIFEPYFTTKGERGSGLGLAMVFAIVDQHGGSIEVSSEPERGTLFRIKLPRADTAAELTPVGPVPRVPEEGMRILVVDDEPSLRLLAHHILRQQGHSVSVSPTAEEALAILAGDPIDVVISDLGLGKGLNGWELADRVRERWPAVKFILVTGWGAALELSDARLRGVHALVAKPYRPAELVAALASVTSRVETS
jgi:PAS domain S-box-containing protein